MKISVFTRCDAVKFGRLYQHVGETFCLHYPDDGSSGFLRNVGIIYQTSRFYHTILKRPTDMITHYKGTHTSIIIIYNILVFTVCFRRPDWATHRNMPILPVLRPVTVRTVRSPHPSLAAQRASLTPRKINEI
jgi:hypothetical protein